MKKIILLAILMTTAFFVNAQQSKTDSLSNAIGQTGNNEIKVNLLHSILGLVEVNYERIIQDNMGIGLGVFVNISDDDFEYNYGFVPHYRVYFGAKKASGFFIEGNMAVISVKENTYYSVSTNNGFYSMSNTDNKINFGLGAAAGAKFLTRNGFLGEAYLGVGRFVGGNRSIEAYPRVGITIGKRF